MSNNHGFARIYEQGDQVNYGRSNVANEERHHTRNAEGYRPKDQNKAMNQMLEENIQDDVAERYKHDPTYRATMHGNEPSKGAKIDAEIQREEEELLRRKQEKTDSLPGKKQ
ncbi:uncharacterized protein GGS22DRAFT_3444 [Annulohypoxylon maeteangense]|uniref:uncharacterized protein n=1 Tax=Annulohypoxylon maeteangense TaxID=1927788 RepID=UPI0020083B34|nr:uncharacterized protein GGS22DRAFT_3444 [Annulohypoxylon maeteangense]KAI0889739.1 hypothetical protein GGS22DRAFT_3444 [Annulohypoxylon maeteangense]